MEERVQKEIEDLRSFKEQFINEKTKDHYADSAKKEFNEKELEYQRHIEALKDVQYNTQLKTQKEYEELKTLIQVYYEYKNIIILYND